MSATAATTATTTVEREGLPKKVGAKWGWQRVEKAESRSRKKIKTIINSACLMTISLLLFLPSSSLSLSAASGESHLQHFYRFDSFDLLSFFSQS